MFENYHSIRAFVMATGIATLAMFAIDSLVWIVRDGDVEHLMRPNPIEPS